MRARVFLPFLLIFSFLLVSGAPAATIVVVKGGDSAFNRKIFSGFSSLATEKLTGFNFEAAREAGLIAQIRKLTPDLIFSIGQVPLRKFSEAFPATPIVVCQPLGENLTIANVLRMDSEQPIRSSLSLIQALFPTRKTIGTVYNPRFSQPIFNDLVAEGAKLGLRIASLKVDSPSDVKTLINALTGKIDVFLWIRDATTASEAVVKALYGFTAKNSLPVVTPEPDHLARGALLAVAYDPFKLGEQAWETAKLILKEKKIPQAELVSTTNPVVVQISLGAAARFGIGSDLLYTFFQRTLKQNFSVSVVP